MTGGRIALAVALLAAWEWGARAFGPLFFAPPLATAQRIVEMAGNGKLLTDTIATLRVSVMGFVIGCAAGVGLAVPAAAVAARRPRPIEPFILASHGHPEIRADAVADPVVRHRRCAEGRSW